MMKELCTYLTGVALTALVLVAPGCGTAHRVGSRSPSSSEEQRQSTPFLDSADYPERLGVVMRDALASHRFSTPWIVVRGSDGSLWFVAERFQSEHEFDRINVHVTAGEHLTASITPYHFGPSDWAILGPLFADCRPEAELIAKEITRKLSSEKNAARR
jgi:hypothetical protein